MSRDTSVSSTRRLALASTLLFVFLTGCIFSPDREVIPEEPPITVAEKPADVVQVLATAYRTRNLDLFKSILANDEPNKAQYLFITAPSPEVQDEQWGYTEEVRVHRRMFTPWDLDPGDTPVEDEIWLVSVSITLTQETAFTARPDLYASAENPDGLDPARWLAEDAIYGTDVLFQLQGDTDYAVNGRANFVILTDLTKEVGDKGKFLLFQWNDLDTNKPRLKLPS